MTEAPSSASRAAWTKERLQSHNMNPQMADPDYVKANTTDPALETAFLCMECGGISVTLKKR